MPVGGRVLAAGKTTARWTESSRRHLRFGSHPKAGRENPLGTITDDRTKTDTGR